MRGRFSTNPCPRRRSGGLPRLRCLPASARSADSTPSRSGSRFPHRSCRTGANRDPPRDAPPRGSAERVDPRAGVPSARLHPARWSSTASGLSARRNWSTSEIVLHLAHANDVGDDSLCHAPLAVRADAPIERNDMVVNRHRDVGEIQTAMFTRDGPERVASAHRRPDRRRRRCSRNHAPCVTSLRSPSSACPAGRAVTGKTDTKRRTRTRGCLSSRWCSGAASARRSHRWPERSTSSGT